MRLHIKHITHYHFSAPVDYGLQQLRLTPKERVGQHILRWDISITGGKKEAAFDDQHANHVDLISITPGNTSISIDCEGEVDVSSCDGIVGQHQGMMPLWCFMRPTPLTRPGPKIRALLTALGQGFSGDIARAHALSALIVQQVPYTTGVTDAGTSAEEAMQAGCGVCQDHAHIFITAARLLGHPARYVSGYLLMNDRVEQDATHAWAEVYLEGIGWIGFDVSNGYSPDDRYIRVATGLDYRDASPVLGMRYGAADENMMVQLQVQQ